MKQRGDSANSALFRKNSAMFRNSVEVLSAHSAVFRSARAWRARPGNYTALKREAPASPLLTAAFHPRRRQSQQRIVGSQRSLHGWNPDVRAHHASCPSPLLTAAFHPQRRQAQQQIAEFPRSLHAWNPDVRARHAGCPGNFEEGLAGQCRTRCLVPCLACFRLTWSGARTGRVRNDR